MTAETQKIRKAAALILNKGWCQGTCARDPSGKAINPDLTDSVSFCAMGAMMRSDCLVETRQSAYGVFGGAIPLGSFNDAPDTKAEDVANALLLAAEILETENA